MTADSGQARNSFSACAEPMAPTGTTAVATNPAAAMLTTRRLLIRDS